MRSSAACSSGKWSAVRASDCQPRSGDRLVSELARLREASLALQEAPAEPGDPAELRERLARTLTLAQVDEVFRDELGVGVAEFVRDMNPDAVEDVSRLSQHKRIALVLVLSVWTEHATSTPRIAAHINDEEIPTAAVDAMSVDQAQRIRNRLMEAAHQALEDLIDQRLGIDDMPEASRSRKRAEIYRAHNVKLTLPQPEALENTLPPDQLVAVVAGDPIRARELEHAAALRLYRLRGELYLQRRRDLDRLIEQRLLQLEAQRRGVSLESLEESFSKVEPVTDAEVENFVSRERAAGRVVEDRRTRSTLSRIPEALSKPHERAAGKTRRNADPYRPAPARASSTPRGRSRRTGVRLN